MARRSRGTAADRTADRAAAPDGVEGALNGVEPPGARTMGAIAVARWAARSPGEPSEGLDEGDTPLTQGPYDDGDLDPGIVQADRVDFGAVRIPVPRDGQVSVEPEAGRLQAVHVMLPTGRLSVSALAAPRSARLWPDLAAEIDESLREGGATVRSFTGPWGRELHARTGEASSVFVGVDGPRWMLYGVATGPTAAARELDAALRRMLRGVVVVRGRAPYPVRTVLPLTVPEHLAVADPGPAEVERVPAARNGRFARGAGAPGRPRSAGPDELPARPRGAPTEVPPPVPVPMSASSSVPDPGAVPTEPTGLRRVMSPGTNGHAGGRPPRLNGASAPRQYPDTDAGLRPPVEHRDPFPVGNGRPPAGRPDQDVSSTGQRRVADLLAEAQRERAAQEARDARQREARERAEREARERAVRERAVQEARERAAYEARERAAQEARERAAQERAAQEARERAAQERAALEARERAAQLEARERAAQLEARERAAQLEARERAAQERAVQEARERAAQERAALEAQRERAAQEARDRAAAQPPAAYRPAWSPAEPAGLRDGLPAAGGPFGGTIGGHRHDAPDDGYDGIAPLRLGGAPRTLGPGGPGGGEPSYDPGWPTPGRRSEPAARPTSDGSDDWTLPMAVVPPEPGRASGAPTGQPEDDLWAGDPWAAETRRAARAGRAAERRQERPPPPDEGGRRSPDPEWSPPHRTVHHRPSHGRPGDPSSVDVPAARVPPPVPPAWAHLPDDRADPYDESPSGRHRRPER